MKKIYASLNAAEYDISDGVRFTSKNTSLEESSFMDFERRVSTTKTLDGGVYVLDKGYAPLDKQLIFVASLSDAEASTIQRIVTVLGDAIVTLSYGSFKCVISEVTKLYGGNTEITVVLNEVA